MRVAVLGQRSFGAAVVAELHTRGHDVVVVSPLNRTDRGHWDRTHVEAHKRGLSWSPSGTFGPESAANVDLIVAAHSHDFIGAKTRAATRFGAVGFHPSLLPRHRGRDAVRWTVAMRDPIAGGSVYQLDDGVDTGPVLAQEFVHVDPSWDHHDLWSVLFPLGVEMLGRAVSSFEFGGGPTLSKQDERFATWEPSWERPRLHRPELIGLPSGG